MGLLNTSVDGQEIKTVKPNSEMIIDQVPTLPLHFKLVLHACVNLLSQNKKDGKAALNEVFTEYRRLATELNIESLSISRINELAKELEMLGFLKCSYMPRREGRVRSVRFLEPPLIPKCASILNEGLDKVRLEKNFAVK